MPAAVGQGEFCSWNEEDARAFSELMLCGTRQLGVVMYGAAGQITGWNRGARFITGFADSDVLGRPLGMLFVPEDRALRLDEHERNTAGAVGFAEDERWHLRKDGSVFWSSGVSVPIRRHGAEVTGFVKVFRDATHLRSRMKSLENLVQQSQGQRMDCDRLIGTVAHELRNPLAPLKNAIELMGASPDVAAAQSQSLGIMRRQLAHLERLVEDLMDFTRVQAGKLRLAYETVVLQELLSEALGNCRIAADQKGVALASVFPPSSIEAQVDPQRLLQVVVNLLNNAIKFTPGGGRVWLTFSTDLSHFLIQVTDNGRGISSPMLPRIFEAFTQASETESHRGAGLGLGLAVVKEIVSLHGGTVDVRSEGPAKGSEFVVRIPLRPAPSPEPTPAEAPPGPSRRTA
ncbi:PAS domain-containing sensor histidine kinase [Ideonella sp. YS5]|uniref:PAS domain-containing sensor histidine kinase n=1 Tax=Ideonella sp. YS5 TaxID=3453714 RepID=UPI003EECC690